MPRAFSEVNDQWGAEVPLSTMYVPPAGLLAMLPPPLRIGRINAFFTYAFSFLTLGASATSTTQFTVDASAEFVVLFANCISTDSTNATVQTYVPQLVQFRDTGSGQLLNDSAIPFNTVYGDAQNPGIFAMPYPMHRNATLQITHQNLEATARNVRGVFVGFKSWLDPEYRGGDTNVWD